MLRIYLNIISDEMTPEEICDVLSLKPDVMLGKGEATYHPKATAKKHQVKVFHQVKEQNGYIHFGENLRTFIEMLESHQNELVQLSKQCQLWINCVDETLDGFPALNFENDLLGKMSRLNLNLDIDLYP